MWDVRHTNSTNDGEKVQLRISSEVEKQITVWVKNLEAEKKGT